MSALVPSWRRCTAARGQPGRLPAMVTCACGRSSLGGETFCPACGRPIGAAGPELIGRRSAATPSRAVGVAADPEAPPGLAQPVAPATWPPGAWLEGPPAPPAVVSRGGPIGLGSGLAALLVLAVVGVTSFAATYRLSAVGDDARRVFQPAPIVLPAATLSPQPLAVVASRALGGVVTVEAQTRTGEEFGTGWLLDRSGDFVTNNHVIAGRQAVRLVDHRGGTHDAVVMGVDVQQDVAVVRARDGFSGDPLPLAPAVDPPVPSNVVVLASSTATHHGDVTNETLVRLHQTVPVQSDTDAGTGDQPTVYEDMMVLRGAMIFRGNSGGPVLDSYGRVLGIVTLASQSTPQGFAIPIPRVVDELHAFAARQTP